MSRLPKFFSPGEWYHCYSRGIDKRTVFEDTNDYQRFAELLYLSNTSENIHRSDLRSYGHEEIFTVPRTDMLVSIGAYALMPNHFHLLIYETEESGISTFMQKLGTAYTMHFNIKYERSGGLFTKPFRAQHVAENRYFQHAVNYIHMNPVEVFEPGWKYGKVKNASSVLKKLKDYPYSSLPDFDKKGIRPEKNILGDEIFDAYQIVAPQKMLEGAQEYYTNNVKASP